MRGDSETAGKRQRRMSVEQPLWQALTGFRVLTLMYALVGYGVRQDEVAHPPIGWIFLGVLTVWTLATFRQVSSAERCTYRFLAADIGMALTGIMLTTAVETSERIAAGEATLPSIWSAGPVLGFAVKGGWRWGAGAAAAIGVSNVLQRGSLVQDNVHNIVLLAVASTAIGYVVEVARSSERTLARALQIDAATRERERLARGIHDNVLQVLAMVQRRGTEAGGPAAELGRLAGEQEAALRALVTGAALPRQRRADDGEHPVTAGEADDGPVDLRLLLMPYASARIAVAEPGTPVLLAADAAAELAAAVGAALDNVRRHAGDAARAWILLEEEPDAVLVTVRDDGPGIPAGRLDEAQSQGRLGAAQSIRGRLRDLGGTATWVSPPGQGTEVELRLPRTRAGGRKRKGGAG